MGDPVPVRLMVSFSPNGGNGARLILDDAESDLIRRLAGELRALLSDAQHGDDPVVDRLFPSAYDDARDEAGYRDLIGDDLVSHKLAALDAVSTSLGDRGSDVDLEGDALHAWLAAITDIRLAIGTRLEVDEDTMASDIDPADPNAHSLAVLHWLGWIQEGILRAATGL